MAATESEVIKEFLVSIGFKIDEAGAKKFRTGMSDTTKDALKLGGAVIGVGLAIEAFVENMANALAKLFYISERSGATVAGLKATEAAFQGIGLQAGVATQAIETVGDALRKPFLAARIRGFGIDVNQPTEKVTSDLEHALARMWNAPGGAGRQPAETLAKDLLGMDERNFVQLVKELPNLDKQMAIMNDRIKESGQDWDAAAKQGAEFSRQLGIIGNDFTNLAAKWMNLNRFMNDSVDKAKDVEYGLHKLLSEGFGAFMKWFFFIDQRPKDKGKPTLSPENEEWHGGPNLGRGDGKGPLSRNDMIEVARADAKANGLEAATLIGQIQTESGFNPEARSEKGAVGVAQWLPEEARKHGFEAGKDAAEDIRQMAKQMAYLRDKYNGNMRHALEAYHAGETNEDAYLRNQPSGVGPRTLAYPDTVAKYAEQARLGTGSFAETSAAGGSETGGSNVFAPQVTNHFNITGSGAEEIGESVGDRVRRENSDLFRDGQGMFGS